MDKINDNEVEDVLYITLEDGSEVECEPIEMFEVEGKTYIALLPVNEEEILLYEYIEINDKEFELDVVAEEMYNNVEKAFNEIMDQYEDYED